MTPDTINGLYEFLGSVAVWVNIRAALKDKHFAGIRILPMAFFVSWSWWNCYYYPHLNQWFSFAGDLSIATANLVWLSLMIKYRKEKQ